MKDYDRSLGSHRSGAGVEIEEQGRQRKPSKASDDPLLVGVEAIFDKYCILCHKLHEWLCCIKDMKID